MPHLVDHGRITERKKVLTLLLWLMRINDTLTFIKGLMNKCSQFYDLYEIKQIYLS